MQLKLLGTACAVLAILAVVSCGIGERGLGSLKIEAPHFEALGSILPPISMDPAEWRVTSTGGPQIIDAVVSYGGGTIEALLPGTYNLVVIAQNAEHHPLGVGTAVGVVVHYGQTTAVVVDVFEYETPDGGVTGSIQWEPDIVVAPVFTLTMRDTVEIASPGNGEVVDVPFILDLPSCTGTAPQTDVHPGWWTAVGRLYDNDRPSTGFATAVRVAAGVTTPMNISMHATQTSGTVGLTFTWTGHDELELTGTPAPGDVPLYEGNEIDLVVASPEPDFTATWYINGEEVGTGPSLHLSSASFNQDEYFRVDCVAISQDLQRAGSLTWTAIRSSYSPAMVRISGNVNVSQFPGGTPMRVKLIAADGTTELGLVSVTNGLSEGNFAFNALEPSTYFLKAEVIGGGTTDWSWWTPPGSVKVLGAEPEAGRIVIPQSGSDLFNFTMPIGG